jgi:hypothetical protein
MYWTHGRPTAYRAACTRAAADALMPFDHHVVEVDGMRGIMLTYQWLDEADSVPRELVVITNPSPRHLPTAGAVRRAVDGHPDAPAHIQAVVDALDLQPAGTP